MREIKKWYVAFYMIFFRRTEHFGSMERKT